MTPTADNKGEAQIHRNGSEATLRLTGQWRHASGHLMDTIRPQLTGLTALGFETSELTDWDASLAVQIQAVQKSLTQKGIEVLPQGLPSGLLRLLELSEQNETASDVKGVPRPFFLLSLIEKTGRATVSRLKALIDLLAFIGETSIGCLRMATGNARYRREDLWILFQNCGAEALPIISMISLVIGVIFAFVGSVQLRLFGAQVYVADIVGIGMAREMGAMMTGIIMAGRTGAAFAAQLGTMQVNEEVDALSTMGMNPVEYLVVPRLTALLLMMPLLCVYAIFMGIAGGMIIGVTMLDISIPQYFAQTRAAVDLGQFAHGIAKSGIFGVIIAVSGCYHGMACGRSASAVGDATTKAVVSAIVAIILADGFIAVVSSILGV